MMSSSTVSIVVFTIILSTINASPPTTSTTTITTSDDTQTNVVELLRCYKLLQESGKRIHMSYVEADKSVRLFDSDGVEVSCDETEQMRLREKSDRRCIFSPIHCLFNKRIHTAKLLAKLGANGSSRLYSYSVRRK